MNVYNKPLELVIEGCKGAGKGTTIGLVEKGLEKAGISYQVSAPFNEVRLAHQAKTQEKDFAYLWNKSPEDCSLAENMIEQAIEDARAKAHEQAIEVLLFDRGWITLMAALEDGVFIDETDKQNRLKKAISKVAPAFFLRVTPEVVMQRRGSLFYDKSSQDQAKARVERDCSVRDEICTKYSSRIIQVFDTSEGMLAFERAAAAILEKTLNSLNK